MNIYALAARCSLTIVVFIGGAAFAGETSARDETAARNEAIVREAFDQWARGGSVFDILAPDVIWTIRGSGPFARTYFGVEDFLEEAAAPLVGRLAGPIRPHVHNIWAVDDSVLIRFDGTATTLLGDHYRNQFVWIFRMDDGVVHTAEAFLDLSAYQAVIDGNEPVR